MAKRRQVHEAIRSLCGDLFHDPAALRDVVSHRVAESFAITPHAHDDELQFDLLDGAAGVVHLDDRIVPVTGLTLLVHYPGERHGFRLRSGRRWHLKVAADPASSACRRHVWPDLLTDQPPMPRLARIARELAEYGDFRRERPPRLLALVADLLSSWPVRELSALDATAVEDDRDLSEAVRLVQRQAGAPPTVEDMARAAHLSPRHFARRFRARFGCTPAEFADTHRLARAKSLLLGGQHAASEVAHDVGFTTHSAFTRWFTRQVGQTPSAFRRDPHAA